MMFQIQILRYIGQRYNSIPLSMDVLFFKDKIVIFKHFSRKNDHF